MDFLRWLDPAVQVLVAFGTISLAWLAYRLSRKEAERAAQSEADALLEQYWIPMQESLGGLRIARTNVVGPAPLQGALMKQLDRIHDFHRKIGPATRTSPDATRATVHLRIVGVPLVKRLQELAAELNRLSDEIGNELFGDPGRKENPQLILQGPMPGSQVVLQASEQVDVAMRRLSLSDWLRLRAMDPHSLAGAIVMHGQAPARKIGADAATQLIGLWYEKLKANGFEMLGHQLEEFRLAIEDAERAVQAVMAKHINP